MRLSFLISKCLKYLTFLFSIFLYLPKYIDTDIWWHLRLGEVILNKSFVNTLTYTCTKYIWINYSWATDIFFYKIYSSLGYISLALISGIVYAIGVYINYKTVKYLAFKEKGLVLNTNFFYIGFSIFNLILLWFFLYLRPQNLSYLFVSLSLYILIKTYYEGIKVKFIIIFSLLMVLWANTHGSFIIAIALISLFIFITLFDLILYTVSDNTNLIGSKIKAMRNYLIFLGLSLVLPLINPFGINLWTEALSSITSSLNTQLISEWGSINFHSIQSLFYLLIIFIIIGLVIFNKTRDKIRLILLAFAILIGFYSVRYQLIADIIIGINLSLELYYFFEQFKKGLDLKLKKQLSFSLILLLVVFIFLTMIMSIYSFNETLITSRDIVTSQASSAFPLDAVKYIKSNSNISKLNFFNAYAWGGYLDFVYPEKLWFIDGRMSNWRCSNIKDSNILEDTLQIEQLGSKFNNVIDTYKIEAILISKKSVLDNALLISKDWKVVYSDNISEIFIKI